MLSRRNVQEQLKANAQKSQRFALRKLNIGLASVLLGISFTALSTTQVQAASGSTPAAKTEEVQTPVIENKDAAAPAAENKTAQPTSSEAEKPATVEPAKTAPADKQTSEQPVKAAPVAKKDAAKPVAKIAEKKTEKKSEEPDSDQPFKVMITFKDVGTGGKLRTNDYVISRGTYSSMFRGNDVIAYLGIAPAGYKLLNPQVLDQYFHMEGNIARGKGEDITVELDYAPISTVLVKYVDEADGTVLASTFIPSANSSSGSRAASDPHNTDKTAPEKSQFKAEGIEIPGYELVGDKDYVGTYDNAQTDPHDPNYQVVTFRYKKVMDNANPQESHSYGPQYGEFFGTDWKISDERDVNNLPIHAGYTYEEKNVDVEGVYNRMIKKYVNQGFTYVGNVNYHTNKSYFNYNESGQFVDLVPNKNVTVSFIDEDGKELQGPVVLYGNPDNPAQANHGVDPANHWYSKGEWTATPAKISGYHLVKTYGATKGQYNPFAYNVTFVYAKGEDQPSNPGDKPTNPGDKPTNPGDKPSTPSDKPTNPGKTPDIPDKPNTDDNVPQTPDDQTPDIPEKPSTEPSTEETETHEVPTTTPTQTTQTSFVTPVTARQAQSGKTVATAAQPAKQASHDSIWAALGLMMMSLFGLVASDKRRKEN